VIGQVLDVGLLYRLVDERRQAAGLSWRQLAGVLGTSPSSFTRMSHGRAPEAALLVGLVLWLGWAPELALLVRGADPAGGDP
jgi:transcriptional regulator with XRE-family HTH domain